MNLRAAGCHHGRGTSATSAQGQRQRMLTMLKAALCHASTMRARSGTPAMIASDAQVCRRVWNDTCGVISRMSLMIHRLLGRRFSKLWIGLSVSGGRAD
jgi:hypothetical protein